MRASWAPIDGTRIPVCPCGYFVDWVRSCYETDMRFPGVGVVRVRWFKTDKPALPFPTVYQNTYWTRKTNADLEYDYGDAGEIRTAKRPWRNGKGPKLGDCTGPQGSPEAWMGLSDAGSPLFKCGDWGGAFDAAYDADYDSAEQLVE